MKFESANCKCVCVCNSHSRGIVFSLFFGVKNLIENNPKHTKSKEINAQKITSVHLWIVTNRLADVPESINARGPWDLRSIWNRCWFGHSRRAIPSEFKCQTNKTHFSIRNQNKSKFYENCVPVEWEWASALSLKSGVKCHIQPRKKFNSSRDLAAQFTWQIWHNIEQAIYREFDSVKCVLFHSCSLFSKDLYGQKTIESSNCMRQRFTFSQSSIL